MEAILETRKSDAQAWFEALQLKLIAAIETLEAEAPQGAPDIAPGRFELEPWKRVDHSGAPGGGGRMAMLRGRVFEKMGVARFDRLRNLRAGIRQADSRRRRGPALLGVRLVGDRPSLEPECADRAHEHPLRRDLKSVVRRRRRSDADAQRAPARRRSGYGSVSRRDARGLRAPSGRRVLRQIQSVVRRLFLPQASRRTARSRRRFLRLFQQRWGRGQFRAGTRISLSRATSAKRSSRSTPRLCAAISPRAGRKTSAKSNSCGAAATSSSICSTIAARCSASRPAAMSHRSSPQCRRSRAGLETVTKSASTVRSARARFVPRISKEVTT